MGGAKPDPSTPEPGTLGTVCVRGADLASTQGNTSIARGATPVGGPAARGAPHDIRGRTMGDNSADRSTIARRTVLRLGALGGAGLAFGAVQGVIRPRLGWSGLLSPDGAFAATSDAWPAVLYLEVFPTSPLILSPFTDPLPVPKALAPVPKSEYTSWTNPPGPGRGAAELAGQPAAPDLAEPGRVPRPDRVQDRPADPARTRSPPRRCCRSTRTAARPSRSREPARARRSPTRRASSGRCRRARSTASTARSRAR